MGFPAFLVLVFLEVASASPWYGGLIGATYGLARAVPMIAFCFPKDVGHLDFDAAVAKVLTWRRRAHLVNGLSLAVIAGLVVAAWIP